MLFLPIDTVKAGLGFFFPQKLAFRAIEIQNSPLILQSFLLKLLHYSLTKMVIIEACCDSLISALNAVEGGANRIELCSSLVEGGVTPSYGLIKLLLERFKEKGIEINVLIRPRGGDFLYTKDEINIMLYDIEIVKTLGAHGVVIGVLLKDGNIDEESTKLLINKAQPMSITFHRAFDVIPDPIKGLETLINLNSVHRLLTSGQSQSALEGAELIQKLVTIANDKIIILPGGGIDETNVKKLVQLTGVKEIHCSARHAINSMMEYKPDKTIFMGGEKINTKENEYLIKVASSVRFSKIQGELLRLGE